MKRIICLIMILFLVGCEDGEEVVKEKELQCSYFTPQIFERNLALSKDYEIKKKPLAVIVPHNESQMDMTASVLRSTSKYQFDTVIVLAPNHEAKGGKLLISGRNWHTPAGDIKGNEIVKNKIIEEFGLGIKEEFEVIQKDHSASVILPYISKYMEKTKVVTILFSKSVTIKDMKKLSKVLYDVSLNENVLLLGSLDFSHYQPDYKDIQQKDNETVQMIENFEISRLKEKDGNYIDSTEAMGVILEYIWNYGNKQIDFIDIREVSNMPQSNDYGSYFSIVMF